MTSEPMIAIGMSRSGFFVSSPERRDRVEADVGEEDQGGGLLGAAEALGKNGEKLSAENAVMPRAMKMRRIVDLDHDHDQVRAGASRGLPQQRSAVIESTRKTAGG